MMALGGGGAWPSVIERIYAAPLPPQTQQAIDKYPLSPTRSYKLLPLGQQPHTTPLSISELTSE